ncbi:unnamed protein product [Dicrocoelium dendriticum]|nr:unnamed protein product [Dicrocoelium dendriticum]
MTEIGEPQLPVNDSEYVDLDESKSSERVRKQEPYTRSLDNHLIRISLCAIQPTVDGLSFAPSKFVCNNRLLSEVDALKKFIFLCQINIAFNELTDLTPLEHLHNLMILNASYNQIEQFPTGKWPRLTHLHLHHNRISQLRCMCMPRLKVLSLNFNRITRLYDPDTGEPFLTDHALPQLHTLELAHNRLYLLHTASSDDVSAPNALKIELSNLRALFLDHNALTTLAVYKRTIPMSTEADTMEDISHNTDEVVQAESNKQGSPGVMHAKSEEDDFGSNPKPAFSSDNITEFDFVIDEDGSALGQLPQLSVLSLRANGMRELDGFTYASVPNLQYLNLRENMIASMKEVKKLRVLPSLETIILLDNPIYDTKAYRLEMRVSIKTLRRLDKDVYTAEENEEADQLAEMRKTQSANAET